MVNIIIKLQKKNINTTTMLLRCLNNTNNIRGRVNLMMRGRAEEAKTEREKMRAIVVMAKAVKTMEKV